MNLAFCRYNVGNRDADMAMKTVSIKIPDDMAEYTTVRNIRLGESLIQKKG